MKKILSGLLTVCLLVSMLAVADTPIKAEAASTSGSLEQRITQLQKKNFQTENTGTTQGVL